MILVTGATGTVGSILVQQLQQSGATFKVLVRNPDKARSQGVAAEIVRGDLAEPASIETALKGVDALFLLTPSTPDSAKWHANAYAAAKKTGVARVVRLSVIGADRSSPVALSRWHAQSDDDLRATGLKWTVLRPGYFMQNFLGSAASIRREGAFYGASKQGRVAMIDARDIAAVAAKVLVSGGYEGKTWDLTGPEAITQDDAAKKLSALLGRPVKYVDLPPEKYKAALLGAGIPEWLASDFIAMNAQFASGGAAAVTPAVEQVTGRKARTFDQFVEDYAKSFA